jgi:hypothetical protein
VTWFLVGAAFSVFARLVWPKTIDDQYDIQTGSAGWAFFFLAIAATCFVTGAVLLVRRSRAEGKQRQTP